MLFGQKSQIGWSAAARLEAESGACGLLSARKKEKNVRGDLDLMEPDSTIQSSIDEVNRLYHDIDVKFRQVEEGGSPAQVTYMQGKKDGMRLAMAILIPDLIDRPSLMEIATAREKWRGSDIEALMESDETDVRNWSHRLATLGSDNADAEGIKCSECGALPARN